MNARAELLQATAVFDHTASIHFRLASANLHGTGVQLTGGEGDAVRPNEFTGVLSVTLSGFAADIDIVSMNGVFYAKLPFATKYEIAKPSDYGFGDPSTMLDPNLGLASLMSAAKNPTSEGDDRLSGEELEEVGAAIPGHLVANLLTSADPSEDVQATVGIAVTSHQVRRIVLTGPFFAKGQDSTYTLLLDHYGERVTVTPPA